MTKSGLNRRDLFRGAGVATLAAGTAAACAPGSEAPSSASSDFKNIVTTSITVNGVVMQKTHEARVTLLDYLREILKLSGTKKGCDEGACGACTVLLDGERVNGCMTLAAACDGRSVTTAEGLAGADGALDAVQRAFIDQDAFQCGYCTSGQVVSAVACIREGHTDSPEQIAEWMSGNICRCSAYPQIVAAVQQAAEESKG